MDKTIRIVRLVLGVLGLAAILTQMSHGLRYNNLQLTNFFSFFTIQSNILIVVILILGALMSAAKFDSLRFQLVRGAVTSFIMTTGIVYFLFLRGMEAELQTTIPWVNAVLHTLLPLYAIADWVFVPSRHPIEFRRIFLWLLYPVAYLVYTLTRGVFVDWYPYPFLNPMLGSYSQVLISSVMITALILLCSWVVVAGITLKRRTFSAEAK